MFPYKPQQLYVLNVIFQLKQHYITYGKFRRTLFMPLGIWGENFPTTIIHIIQSYIYLYIYAKERNLVCIKIWCFVVVVVCRVGLTQNYITMRRYRKILNRENYFPIYTTIYSTYICLEFFFYVIEKKKTGNNGYALRIWIYLCNNEAELVCIDTNSIILTSGKLD